MLFLWSWAHSLASLGPIELLQIVAGSQHRETIPTPEDCCDTVKLPTMLYPLIRKFFFALDAETAHGIGMDGIDLMNATGLAGCWPSR